MKRTPMPPVEIEALNAAYLVLDAADGVTRAELVWNVAMDANLTPVKRYDQSGVLFCNHEGRFVFGWDTGGFDDQVD